jgi:multiple sugar transport system permease protein
VSTEVARGEVALSTTAHAAERPGSAARRSRDNRAGLAFAAPFLALFLAFLVWPIAHGLYLSFTGQTLTGAGGSWVGLANYTEAFADPVMWRSLANTALFTVMSTVPLVLVALAMALLVNLGIPGQWLWRLSFFMPFLLASTVVALFWTWMYNPQLGLVNWLLAPLGIDPVAWLQDERWAMTAVVVTTLWWTVGFNFLLYLAALQNIPEQQYEAAAIDGAGPWRQLFSITIPQLGPTTVLIVILQVIASLKVFDQIYMMTNGGPNGATRPVVQYIFEAGFTGYRFGYSAAISYVFFTLIIIVSLVQLRITARRSA